MRRYTAIVVTNAKELCVAVSRQVGNVASHARM